MQGRFIIITEEFASLMDGKISTLDPNNYFTSGTYIDNDGNLRYIAASWLNRYFLEDFATLDQPLIRVMVDLTEE